MATTYLQRTNTSGTSTQKGTISVWIKSGEEPSGNNQTTLASWSDANNHGALLWNGSDKIDAFDYQSGYASQLQTDLVLRDCSGWYHIVYSWDTTLSTANDRQKIYINGVEPSYGTRTNYSVNAATSWNANSYSMRVGALNSSSYFSGLMSYVAFVDGTQELPTIFGETDTTTGQWKIKTDITPSVAWGTNGFLILKNGNSLTDESTNSNNFTLGGGTLTNTKDCPDNVFCTMNPLDNYYANSVFSNGNTTVVTNAGNYTYNTSTIGINVGMKAYWEAKYNTTQSGNGNIGVIDTPSTSTSAGIYQATNGISVDDLGKIYKNNSDTGITLGTLSTSDVICFAYDNVNGGLYVRKNGDAWINSGVPTSGASKTGIISPTTTGLTMFPAVGDASGSSAVGSSTNFGNGVFGTTAVTSAGTNASGNGIFEYDVPTGYTALSTKGLNA